MTRPRTPGAGVTGAANSLGGDTKAPTASVPKVQVPAACKLVDWKSFEGSPLIGKAAVAFPSGLVIANIPVFRRHDGGLSAGTPDMPIVDAQGQQLRDRDGKRRYAKIITFETDAARQRWVRDVLSVLAAAGIVSVAP